jgi:hypothetical protein
MNQIDGPGQTPPEKQPFFKRTSTKMALCFIIGLFIAYVLSLAYMAFTAQPVPAAIAPSPVLFFYSDSCHYCQLQLPIVENLTAEGYLFNYMDVGAHPDYWTVYDIQGTPTFIAANGDRKVGLAQYNDLKQWLDEHGAK